MKHVLLNILAGVAGIAMLLGIVFLLSMVAEENRPPPPVPAKYANGEVVRSRISGLPVQVLDFHSWSREYEVRYWDGRYYRGTTLNESELDTLEVYGGKALPFR